MSEPKHKLVITADGKAELLREGVTVWASDDDPDFADEFGDDSLTPNNELSKSEATAIVAYVTDMGHIPIGADVAIDWPDSVHLIEDDDDDELDPDWDDDDDDDDDDDTEAQL